MNSALNWIDGLMDMLDAEGSEACLRELRGAQALRVGPVGLLWDDEADSEDAMCLAEALLAMGRPLEARDALCAVVAFQYSQSVAA